ncbi:MAG: hypothetical protein ACJ76H_04310 [Bacteriovoracaceae bacterium]
MGPLRDNTVAMKQQKGQTLVEYILLLSVVVGIVLTFYRSKLFQKYFGNKGMIGQTIKTRTEFAYRHGYMGTNDPQPKGSREGSTHPTYADPTGGSRFFGPKDKYPQL